MTPGAPRLERVSGGCYAYVQPDGGWGLSNVGVVVGQQESLLVDTLFDLAHTAAMLDQVSTLAGDAPLSRCVTTHGNGDHWFGHELLGPDVAVLSSAATEADMRAVGPVQVQGMVSAAGATGDYARRIFGEFDFTGVSPRYPDETYSARHELVVGGIEVLLLELGPAHTAGDTVVHVERDGVVFTGDLLFAGGTPIMWEGPVENWLRACRRIQDLGADLLVPGHGPISPASRLQDMCDYLEFVREEAAPRHAAGMTPLEAALDVDLGRFSGWPEAERLAANMTTVYRELADEPLPAATGPEMFGCMAALAEHQQRPQPQPDD